ncbi:MAG: PAS domain S-box protein, partial [Candidatus Caldatribacteriota bacterium]|nr:PAS domain S-box protein [Candidatus Caldatribacteriota bacterium]
EGKTKNHRVEFRIKTKSGKWKWILGRGNVVSRDSNGKALRFLGTHVDISRRKQMEEEIRKNEKKYRLLAENTLDCIWQMGMDFKFTYVNPSVLQMFGFTPEEWIGSSLSDHCSPENMEFTLGLVKEEIEKGKESTGVKFETYLLCKNGKEVTVEITGKILFDKYENPIGLQGNTRDITERKLAEEKIKHLNLVLRAIRSVNQLIVKEKNRKSLLKGACNNLIKTRGYHSTWIALLDESGKLETYAEAGIGKAFLPIVEMLMKGELTVCGQKALKQQKVVIIEDPASTCSECPLLENHSGRGVMTIRLEYNGKIYGLMSASIPAHLTNDQEEQSLFKEVAGDIAFSINNIELDEERKQAEERLKKTMDAAIDTMSRITEAKDPYTSGHQHRVCQLAVPLARELGLSPDKIEGIRIASLIHDIGKIGLPAEILSKPTNLTDIELSLIKGHSQIGYDILKSIDFSYPVAQIVLQHHENIDGSGYPNGLKDNEISIEAKILRIADTVEAMS